MLPKVSVPTGTVEVEGQAVQIRALTRAENLKTQNLIDKGDLRAVEVYIIATATDTPEHEVGEWWDNTPSGIVAAVIGAVRELTNPTEEDHKSNST